MKRSAGKGNNDMKGKSRLRATARRSATAGTTIRASAQTWLRASRVRRVGRLPARSTTAAAIVRRSARSRTRFSGPPAVLRETGPPHILARTPRRTTSRWSRMRMGVCRCGRRGLSAEGWLEPSGRGSRRRGNIVGGVSWPTFHPLCTLVGGHSSLWRGRGRRGVESWTTSRAHLLGQRQGRRGLCNRRAGRVASCLGQRAQGGWCTRWLPVLYLFVLEDSRAAGHARSSSGPQAHECLPSNTPAQQEEADVGWLLAARSATFMDAVRCSAKERSVQAVATLGKPSAFRPAVPVGRPGGRGHGVLAR